MVSRGDRPRSFCQVEIVTRLVKEALTIHLGHDTINFGNGIIRACLREGQGGQSGKLCPRLKAAFSRGRTT